MIGMKVAVVFSFLTFVPYAAAHGYVSELDIDGKSYSGNEPTENGQPTDPSVVRRISKIDPVKGADNPSVNCGNDADSASLSATAQPGSAVNFKWIAGGGQNWPHDMGPMLTYMASCGESTCDQFDSTTAKWFKIDEAGLKKDGTWVLKDLMDGTPANITLPKNIAPGNYLIRHEIIALHLADSKGGAEFYPSCSQLTVSGSGTGTPSSDELVSLPGAYSDDDPGIYVKDIFNGLTNYAFPGPPIASFIAGGGSASSESTSASSSPSASASASKTSSSPKPTGASGSSSNKAAGICRLKKQTVVRPRHLSRVMRRLLHIGSF